jgi:hypothetical protein
MKTMYAPTIVAAGVALTAVLLVAPTHAGDAHDPGMVLVQAQPGGGPGAGRGMGGGSRGGGPGMPQGQMFQLMDQNGDGAVSRDEFVGAPRGGPMSQNQFAEQNRATRFDELDRDGNGRLTPDEMPYAVP